MYIYDAISTFWFIITYASLDVKPLLCKNLRVKLNKMEEVP